MPVLCFAFEVADFSARARMQGFLFLFFLMSDESVINVKKSQIKVVNLLHLEPRNEQHTPWRQDNLGAGYLTVEGSWRTLFIIIIYSGYPEMFFIGVKALIYIIPYKLYTIYKYYKKL